MVTDPSNRKGDEQRGTRRHLSFKSRNREQTKERILQEAVKEFSEYGFLGARVERIVKRSDVNMRMLYHYFESKDALYVAVLERVYKEVREAEQKFSVSSRNPEEELGTLIEFTFDHFVKHPELIHLVMGENLLKAQYIRRSSIIPKMNLQLQAMLRRILKAGEQSGAFRADIDPVQLWLTIFSLCWTHLSNRFTLSWMLQTDLSDSAFLTTRREHVKQVVLDHVRR